jgi:hypothetical protein
VVRRPLLKDARNFIDGRPTSQDYLSGVEAFRKTIEQIGGRVHHLAAHCPARLN